jgi:LPS sulfotransferase NodH
MSTKFVIVGAPRTGSTLLVKTLNSLPGVSCHGELLGRDQVRGYEDGIDLISISLHEREARLKRLLQKRNSDPVGFIDEALSARGVATGFKALYSEFLNPGWREVIGPLRNRDNIRFIHLIRKNSLRRFVSEQILRQGGPNHSGAGGRSEIPIKIHFDIDLYLRRSAELEVQASEIEAMLSGQQVLQITYEVLAAETATTVEQVCHFLGLDIVSSDIEPALKKVGATDLQDSVSNYQELLDHPATRVLAFAN